MTTKFFAITTLTILASAVSGQELIPHTQPRTATELGRKASKTRKAARPFSGHPLFPAKDSAAAAQGSPEETKTALSASNGVVEVKSARFSRIEIANGTPTPLVRSAKAQAKAQSKMSAQANSFDPLAEMISPADGSRLQANQTFSWTEGDADEYYLMVGSCPECDDILSEDEGQNTERTVSLPVDGRLLYVTLYSAIDGDWYYNEYQYQASAGQTAVAAQMTAPASGATLGSTVNFSWNAGYGVSQYYLRVGSCTGCSDLLDENEGTHLSRTVNLPTDGRVIYARLFSAINGSWYYYDYQYRAPSVQTAQSVRVDVKNPFLYPITISINGKVMGNVPANSTAGVNVAVSTLSVSFTLVQPTLAGRSLGDAVSGVFNTITNPSGSYLLTVTTHIGTNWYFLPVIDNRTATPLFLEVNGGLTAENRCNCSVPANTERVAAGYYLFYSNSNVRLFQLSNYTGAYTYWTNLTSTDASAQIELAIK